MNNKSKRPNRRSFTVNIALFGLQACAGYSAATFDETSRASVAVADATDADCATVAQAEPAAGRAGATTQRRADGKPRGVGSVADDASSSVVSGTATGSPSDGGPDAGRPPAWATFAGEVPTRQAVCRSVWLWRDVTVPMEAAKRPSFDGLFAPPSATPDGSAVTEQATAPDVMEVGGGNGPGARWSPADEDAEVLAEDALHPQDSWARGAADPGWTADTEGMRLPAGDSPNRLPPDAFDQPSKGEEPGDASAATDAASPEPFAGVVLQRSFTVPSWAPSFARCATSYGYFPAFLAGTNELARCAAEHMPAARQLFGPKATVTCREPKLLDCVSGNGVDTYRYSYLRVVATSEEAAPGPSAATSSLGVPGGYGAALAAVVLPPSKTLGYRGPAEAWQITPPGLAAVQLPPQAHAAGSNLRCLSCEASATALASPTALARCLEEGLAALEQLSSVILAQDPAAEVVLRAQARSLYLRLSPRVFGLYDAERIFAPQPGERCWQAPNPVPPRQQQQLDVCCGAAHAVTAGAAYHPERLQALAAQCLPLARQYLTPASAATLRTAYSIYATPTPEQGK